MTALAALDVPWYTKSMTDAITEYARSLMGTNGPIEVWLRQGNLEITGTQVSEDESTQELGIESLSMRGAQREITGFYIKMGYTPAGRWETEADDGDTIECVRRFKPPKDEPGPS